MGAHYEFTCARCGYSEQVSGGADVGMVARTRTAVCPGCRRLVDVVTWLAEHVLLRHPEDRERMHKCPCCGFAEVQPLDEAPRAIACPRCGAPLSKGEIVALWD